jgi:hypothetical protein
MHAPDDVAGLREEDEVVVAPDGSRIEGWIADDVRCPVCDGPQVYDMRFDAHFCPACNAWREGACADPACAYCPGRPSRPLPRAGGDGSRSGAG